MAYDGIAGRSLPPRAKRLRGRNGRSIGLRLKLMAYFLVILLIPLISLGFVGPYLYAMSIERETNAHMASMIGQVNMNIELRVREMEQLIDFIALTRAVSDFLNGSSASNSARDGIEGMLASVSATHPEIAGVLVASDSDAWASDGFSRTTRDPLVEERWYKEAYMVPGEVRLIPRPIGRNIRSNRSYGADDVVSIVKAVTNTRDGRIRGAVLIDMKLSAIEELFTGSQLGKGGFLFIVDSNDEMVYAPVNAVAYRVPFDSIQGDSSSSIISVAGTDYQVLSRKSLYTGWRTLGVFSLAETLREVMVIRLLTYIIGSVTAILAIIAAFIFTATFAKPILDLRRLMERVEHGDLSVRFAGSPSDEIGELGQGFNEMIGRIQSLIDQVYAEQQSKREAELRILQEQIKPHFLYNTLDTIQWMAQENRVDDVVSMVGALTSLFRIGLNKGREFISLAEEIEHVESYLCIQKMRYEDKFDYSIECDSALRSRRVLRLMLQPLVENAIYHGIKERRGHGSLDVSAHVESGDLVLSVRDDGVGMTEAAMALLAASLEEGGPSVGGYGIRNVHERIRLTFGKPYGLYYSSSYGEGTEVKILHPLLDSEE
jgi:Predicted signal transduction protein with a C-terminal ATPase domain